MLCCFFALLLALVLLSGSVAVPLVFRPLYYLQIEPLHLTEQSGLTFSQIKTAYDEVMDYCLGLSDSFSAGVLSFSSEGASHFADCRRLFLLDLRVLAFSCAVLLIAYLFCRKHNLSCSLLLGRGPGFWAACGLGGVFVLVGALAAVDFERAFVIFHHLFFPGKENWVFNPAQDPVILILPQSREWFKSASGSHPVFMGFAKFALLATAGELIAAFLAKGSFTLPVKLLWRFIIWGLIGVWITFMMKV